MEREREEKERREPNTTAWRVPVLPSFSLVLMAAASGKFEQVVEVECGESTRRRRQREVYGDEVSSLLSS
jgi:hypothetical protein